jgi:hypothetical protein
MDEVKLLALLRSCAMGRNERVHEGLKVWSPPLRESVANIPIVIDTFSTELRSYGSQSFVEAFLEAFNLVVFRLQIISWSKSH